jgi:hypothetical protein
MSNEEYKSRIEARIAGFYKKKAKEVGAVDEAWKSTGPKRKKRAPGAVPTERTEQVRLAKYLDSLGLLWCHVPNEGHGGYGKGAQIKGARLRAEGLKSGVPDCLVFDSCTVEEDGEVKQHKGCAIELKREKGGRVSESQKRWLADLKRHGWFTAVCNGFDEARKVIERLGYGKQESTERGRAAPSGMAGDRREESK